MFYRILIVLFCLMPVLALGQVSDDGKPVKPITNADMGSYNYWSRDTVYNIQGKVYVDAGEVLIIEPGTIVKANTGSGTSSSALVVTRDGRIYAEGTECNPIIFTSILDDVDDAFDLPLPPDVNGRGLWGGVIVLGNATIADPAGENNIEGLDALDSRHLYGGTDDDDNSGVLKYISIRHGGSVIGTANEINGLTLGGVGRGTTIDYVEIWANIDDGIELFGGTVNIKHVVCAFGGDDQIDYDEGWRGAGQFIFTIGDTVDSDTYGEHDGAVSPEDEAPFATPCLSNVTALGVIGTGPVSGTINVNCFNIRDNAGGGYFNSIFAFHAGSAGGILVEDKDGAGSRQRLAVQDLKFQNNMFWGFGGNYQVQSWVADSIFSINQNDSTVDPLIAGVSYGPDGLLDPRPSGTGPAVTRGWVDPIANYNPPANPGITAEYANFFDAVDYMGAFDPDARPWADNWTFLSFAGYLTDDGALADCDCTDGLGPVKPTTDAEVSGFTVWSRDTVYNIQGKVYVDPGDTLLIEPGTAVKANTGGGTSSSALVVTRGGIILALGDECCPIIFTSILDDLTDPFDLPLPPDVNGRGLWGGLIVLGEATIADPAGENNIEGLDALDARHLYGGSDDDDYSGVLKYISIRHGGAVIGTANEINGLTLGGVGRGTTIDYVEIWANIDDGIEFFGGTVNVKHVVCAFGGDDQIDYDEGWRGAGQFIFTIGDTVDSDTYGEHDGAVSPEDEAPFATPCLSNVTAVGVIGSGDVSGTINVNCFNIRDNAGGGYFNSIFAYHAGSAGGILVEDKNGAGSRQRLAVQDLKFQNNMFWGFGGNYQVQSWVADSIFSINQNDSLVDPMLGCINYGPRDSLDPRPDPAGPAATRTWVDPITNYNPPANPGITANYATFFDGVTYMGAFDPNVAMADQWINGWTFLSCGAWLGECRPSSGTCCIGPTVGDCDQSGGVDITDISVLIDNQFLTLTPLVCDAEGDVDFSGIVDITDLSIMIDNQFLTLTPLSPCP